jgi:hypothetical protein
MRIFTAVRHSNDPAYYYGGLWSGNFHPALRELGHDISESQVDLLPTSRFMHVRDEFTRQELEVRAQTTTRILDEVARAHKQKSIDVFLSYFYNAHFDPSGFDELRRLGIPSINFYCNNTYQFDWVAAIAAKADFSWHSEKDARQLYLNIGANPVWIQMGADPNVYWPRNSVNRIGKACFVGQRYADRDRWLAAIIKAGIPVEIYGAGWTTSNNAAAPNPSFDGAAQREYLGRPIAQPGTTSSYVAAMREILANERLLGGVVRIAKQWQYQHETKSLAPLCASHARGFAPDIANIFSSYQVSLNFSNVWADGRPGAALIPHVRLRDFEAPMSAACYITGFSQEIGEFYDLGREIETYRTEDELVDKVRFYLANGAAGEALRAAAYKRARRDHTWVRRFEMLFAFLRLRDRPRTARSSASLASH